MAGHNINLCALYCVSSLCAGCSKRTCHGCLPCFVRRMRSMSGVGRSGHLRHGGAMQMVVVVFCFCFVFRRASRPLSGLARLNQLKLSKTKIFRGFGDIPGPKPYTCIGFGDIHCPKPYTFIGFGDIHGPKLYEFIWFGDINWPQTI